MKAKKLPKLKTLKNKLDKTFNLYIRLRDKKCILSGKKDHLQCSHYYDYLQTPNLRWDERNAHAMTNKIHYKHHHGKAPDYAHWMYEKYGMEKMDILYKDSKKSLIPTREYYIKKTEYYLGLIEKLRMKESTGKAKRTL